MFELETCPARINPWISLLKQQLRRFRRLRQRKPRADHQPFAYAAERLEDRTLLAGPELVAILPNVGNFLTDGEIRNEAPGELTLRFSPGQTIDPTTLGGISIVRSGADGIFGNGNDVTITPGFRGIGSSANEVVVRFAETLADDQYRITIAGTGANTLRNSNVVAPATVGEAFHGGVDLSFNFELDLGAQVTAVVPQPVLRNKVLNVLNVSLLTDGGRFTITSGGTPVTFEFNSAGGVTAGNVAVPFTNLDAASTVATALQTAINGTGLDVTTSLSGSQVTVAGGAFNPTVSTFGVSGAAMSVVDDGLTQRQNIVTVFFNNDPLDATAAANPAFYQLVDTATNAILLPSSVAYSATNNTAKLTFAANLPSSTFRLRIGTSTEQNGTAPTLGTAANLGTLFSTTGFNGSAFVGDNLGQGANDVDLYRFGLSNAGTINVTVTPQLGLDTLLRLFDGNGTAVAATVVNNGAGIADTLNFVAAAGTYYLGVSSNGNATYIPLTGLGAAGGTTTGSYAVNVGTTVLLPASDDNSSFSTASDLGVLGVTGQVISAAISPQTALLFAPEPGGLDEPGHRDIPAEDHYLNPVLETGATPAPLAAITVQDYFFGDVYGTDPQGNILHNAITANQKLRTREVLELYSHYAGIQFRETTSTGIQIVTGDTRAIDPTTPTGPGGVIGLAELGGRAIMDAAENWGNSEYGGAWMATAIHEIGHTLGLGHSYDLPALQGSGLTGEAVFTGDQDFVHFLRLYAPDSTDIDLYRFDLAQSGQFTAETVAHRSAPSSQLDTALVLYRQVSPSVREVVARNDNYFSRDSYINLRLDPGTYFVGVSSTGNTNYDPRVIDSGYGGTSDGLYRLNLGFTADPVATLTDADNTSSTNPVSARTSLDGDADGLPGGTHDFWFESGNTIFVDKSAAAAGANGSITNPYNNLATALSVAASRVVVPTGGGAAISDGQTFTISDGINTPTTFEFNSAGGVVAGNVAVPFTVADSPTTIANSIATAINGVLFTLNSVATPTGDHVDMTSVTQLDVRGTPGLMTAVNLVRIEGNGGADRNLQTPVDALPYLIGRNNANAPLADGTTFNVPQGVTVMVDAAAVFKLQGAIVDVGSSSVNIDRSQSALQILGTPTSNVLFTSFHDDSLGGDSDGVSTGPAPGHWGGLVFRQDSDSNSPANVYLNTVNQGDLRYGGGQVTVNSQLQVFDPVHLVHERPTITYNTIRFSADAAISADPNSFEETPDRVGPKFHANRLTSNSINGVFVRVQTQLGNPVDKLDVPARLDDTEVTYVITENLHVNGNPGGPQTRNEVQQLSVAGNPTGGTFTLTVNGQTTAPIASNAPGSVGINEVQRVSISGAPTGGFFTLGYNEAQQVTITGAPTGGSFTLQFNGQTTVPIAYNAPVNLGTNEVQQVAITGTPTGGTFTLTFGGQTTIPIAYNAPASLGVNEVQQVAITGTPTGGTFTLTFNGQTTANIPYNATSAQVLAALTALGSIGAGNVAVVGGPGPGSAWNVTFQGALAGLDVATLVANGAALTGGVAPAATVGTTTQGITSVEGALTALTSIGAGNVVVTGGPGPGTPWNITFQGAFAELNVSTLVADGTALTGGVAPAASVSTTTQGITSVQGALVALSNVNPGDVTVTGSPLPNTTLTIDFAGQYLLTDVPQIIADGTSLTGGALPFVNVSTTLNGESTFLLASNSTAAQVQNALSSLANIGFGNVVVTGGPAPNSPLTVTFTGLLAGTDVPTLIPSSTLLTGGALPTVAVATTTPGVTSVRAALEALPSIGLGNLIVTGGPSPITPITIEFAGQLSGANVAQITADSSGLTGGVMPTVSPTTNIDGTVQARLTGRLAIDPGVVVKMLGSRIEMERGSSQLIAEGTAEKPIRFTSLNDDSVGAGGTFDTGGNGATTPNVNGTEWGGLIYNATSSGSLDHTFVSYGGGTVPIEGAFDQFNTVEIHQADVRVTNSVFANNADGLALAGSNRNGRGTNDAATIFVRGAQPIIVNNILRNNAGSAISINANSMTSDQRPDPGRMVGTAQRFVQFDDNSGPLLRLNRLENNSVNGMQIRGEELTVEGVWDDTDIVHVLQNEVTINNHHTYSGLRLESETTASLVVKLRGANAGFTANGLPLDIDDRIGGSFQAVGAPGYPVVMTALEDCTVGAGFKPDGQPQTDTLNTGKCDPTAPQPAGNSGAVLIDGSDRDAHGDASVGPDNTAGTPDDINNNGWQFIQQAVNFAATGARNNAPGGVLVIGATAGGGGGGGFGQSNALAAITSVNLVLGLTQTIVTGPGITAANLNNFKVIYVPSASRDTPGGVTDADLALLAARSLEIQAFVNSGGSVVALTEATAALPYSWLQLPLAFQIKTNNLATGPCGFGGGGGGGPPLQGTGTLRLTQAAITAGFTLTAQQLCNGAPYHNAFVGPPGFNGLLPFVLDWGRDQIADNADDDVIALGLQSGSFGLGVRPPANAGDWRSIRLDRYSNDRNVSVLNEREPAYTAGQDLNAIPTGAEQLGVLAPDQKSGDDIRRLGFEIHGFIAADDATDVDVYSFTGTAGSVVWLDIDRTSSALDTLVELIDNNGTVLARSLDNNTRTGSTSTPAFDMIENPKLGGDYYSTNPKDAGMRLVLPGTVGQTGTYFIRVRSQPIPGNDNSLEGGLTTGRYQLQVRLQQRDEKPGSVVTFADIRYASTGVEVLGLPAHSPLGGETTETTANNDASAGAQDIGNLLAQDRNTVSVAGNLSAATDVDFYRLLVDYQNTQTIPGSPAPAQTWATTIDIDYADGLARPDVTLAVFDETGRLVLISRDSNIFDDQPAPGQGSDLDDLSRGSAGKLDSYIGSVQLAESTAADDFYNVAVMSNNRLPTQLDQTFNAAATVPTVRLEPVTSVQRVVEDHIGFSGYTSNSAVALSAGLNPSVQPTTPTLFDFSTAQALNVNVRPFNLADVSLYITRSGGSSGADLRVVNPFTGAQEYTFASYTNMQDIVMRSDGVLFGYESLPGVVDTAGRLDIIDTSSGGVAVVGNDSIPDTVLATDQVDALAWRRLATGSYELYYSVRGGGGGASSTLFRADPANGSAAVVTGQPWGTRGPINSAGVLGVTAGMAFIGGQLFGVSSGGQFYSISLGGGGGGGLSTLIADLSTSGTSFLLAGEGFSGLALGPQNLQGGPLNTVGFYSNMLFALTTSGRLVALNTLGVPQSIFDSDLDGLADSTSVPTATGTGLAFSPLDVNLWHPTIARGTDVGHGINAPFDNTRTPNAEPLVQNTRSFNESQGAASMYFGLEEFNPNNSGGTATYYRLSGTNAQYGVNPLVAGWQQDLTSNAVIGSTAGGEAGNYNVPGGAFGSLISNAFSLQGSSRNDKPTLYFTYFLETQNSNPGDNTMRDAARVFASRNGGSNWELLATNDSDRSTAGTSDSELPFFRSASVDADNRFTNQQVQELFDNTGAWRQARIDLANFAGEANLMLRFDFATAGRMLSRPGENALPNTSNFGNFNNVERAQLNDNEGFFVDDILVGFAERGEMVTGSAANLTTTFPTPVNLNPAPPTETLAGSYQLEIRRGTEYAVQPSSASAQIVVTDTFDTNERMADAITITAPIGAVIIDGQQFTVSDGTTTRTFEFDSNGSVAAGSVSIPFTAADTSPTVARSILNAIQAIPGFRVNGEVVPTSNRVQLIGATVVTPITVLSNINIQINLPSVFEDGSQTATGTITRDVVTNQPLTVTLTTPVNGADIQLTSTTVTIPASQGSVNFFLFGNEDLFAEGTETVVVQASAPGFAPVSATIDVVDNEVPQLAVSIAPGAVAEGAPSGTAVATITRNTPTAFPLTVTVTSLDPSELFFPQVVPPVPVNEVEPNNTLASAQNVDLTGWSTNLNVNIGDSNNVNTSTTIPHITINGTGNNTFDYYAFTVLNPNDVGIFDIDTTNGGFNSEIFLYDTLGNLLATNDDSLLFSIDNGSASINDSFLEFLFTTAGTYFIGVGRFDSTGSPGGITGNTPRNGDSYRLQVSITNHPIPIVGLATTTVVIPAGAASINVPLTTVQDLLADGDQIATIAAYASGHASGTATVLVQDPGGAVLTVNVVAASIAENAGAAATTGTVTINVAPPFDLTINLTSNDTSEATVPATIIISAGQTTSAPFDVNAINDPVLDGNQTVTIIASAAGLQSGSDTVLVTDELTDPPATMGTPSIGRNFTGGNRSQSGFIPPDTMGGVGINHIVEIINGRFAIYNKATGAQITGISLDQFWINAGVTPVGFSFDPRIIFDVASSRWFAVSVDNGGLANAILVAVSQTSNPTGIWTGFRIDSDSDDVQWADYPTLGLDADGVYIACNMFPIAAGPQETNILSIPKADLLGAVPTVANRTLLENVLATAGFTAQPAVDFGISDGRAVILSSGNSGQIRRTSILGAGAAGATLSATTIINVPAFNPPPDGDQPGPTQNLDNSGGNRIAGNVVEVGNTLWAAHAVLDAASGNSAIRWYQFDETTNAVVQTGLIVDANLDLLYPSITANALGDLVIGFTGTSNTQFPSTYVVIGDTFGGVTTFGAPVLTQAGTANYLALDSINRNRWGDYSATMVDPTDSSRFWTFQEWVSAADIWSIKMTEVVIPSEEKDLIVAVTGSNPFAENAGVGASTARVSRSNTTGALTVTVTSSDTSELTLNNTGTGSITLNFANGQAFIDISLDAVDDLITDGTQTVFLTASALGGWNSVISRVDVTDNDPVLALTVDVVATSISEFGLTQLTVTRNGSLTNPLTVNITSSDATEASVPFTVIIPANAAFVNTFVFGIADGIVDGTQTTILTATAAGYGSISDALDVTDVDTSSLFLSLGSTFVLENAGAAATTATVFLSQAQATDLTVFLVSSDTSEVTVPASVVIVAGQTSVTFNVAVVDEFFNDGLRTVTITAYAPGFFASPATLDVLAVDGPNTAGIDSYLRLGDRNLPRDQGQLQIKNNIIRDVSLIGILVDAGARDASGQPHPGSVINTPTLNNPRLVPGVLVENNVVANFATAGIRFSGDPNTGVVPTAPVPFGKLVNNTVYGGATAVGIGFEVTDNASPTLMNNIVANTVTGILIDASSISTVVGTSLFQNNTSNGAAGTNFIQLASTDTLFINPGTSNFYLAVGSQAIDSSLNSLADRPAFVAVTSPLGIAQSPLFAPDYDLYGQLRVDDPSQFPPPGLGSNIFKDRGGIERADFVGPFAEMVTPADNDLTGIDLDPSTTVIHIDNPNLLTQFVLGLRDAGIGIEDALVNSSQFTLTRNGAPMILGTDYLFAYNANTNEVLFTSPSTFPLDSRYTITVDNSSSSGVKDFAGNVMQNNQSNGTTRFTILVTNGRNDPPVNTVPLVTQTINEDTNLVFSAANGNPISLSDPDAFLGTNIVQVTLTVTNGTLTLGSLAGMSFAFNDANGQGDGDGTNDANMNFRGLVTAVNTALAGMRFIPNANFNGSALLTITTNDLGNFGPPPSFPVTDTDTVAITIVAVNDAPTVDVITALNILEDSGSQTVDLTGITIGPANEFPQSLSVTATSSDPTIIPNPTVTYSSANPAGTLMFSPVANASGVVTITVTVTDNGGIANGGVDTFVRTFTVTVIPVNDEPIFDLIADRSVLEDSVPTNISITGVNPGGGADEANQTIVFTAVSSNPGILPNPTVTGSGASRTLTFAPAANAFGTVTVTVTAQDIGGVTNGGDDTFSRTFTITVTSVNDAPTLAVIANQPVAPALLLEDAIAQTVALSGIGFGPANEAPQNLTVTATSSNMAIIPNPIVTYNNGDASGSLTYTPVPNANGTATITVTVMDNGGTTNGGVNSFSRTFNVTVTPVNDAPAFNTINNVTLLEDATPLPQTISITGVTPGGGTDEAGQSVSFTATSNNSALIPNPTITGSGATRTLNFTPAANGNGGPVTITVTGTDSGGTANGGVNTFSQTFTITITPVNDPPTLAAIANPAAILEDSGLRTINFSGITAGPADESGQTLTVTATSSNTALISNPVVTYSSANPTGSLSYTPVLNAFGTATITVTVTDSGVNGGANGDVNFTSRTFTVTVTGVNDAPGMDAINPLVIDEDSGLTTVNLTGINIGPTTGPTNEAPQSLTIAATSNNPGLVPNPTVTYTSANPTGTLSFTPVLNANGSAIISVTVTDNGGTANGGVNSSVLTFAVTVNAVNDAPVNVVPGTQVTNDEDPVTFSLARGNLIQVTDIDAANAILKLSLTPIGGSIVLSPNVQPPNNVVSITQGGGEAGIGYVLEGTLANLNLALNGLQFRPTTDFHGTATLKVMTEDQGNTGFGAPNPKSDTDTINITVNDVNDAPINNVPGVQTVQEDDRLAFNVTNGNAVSITDVDSRNGDLHVVLTVANGTLSLGAISGLTFQTGNGAQNSVMSFTGTLNNVNSALTNLTFYPNANFNGSASFTITTEDQGNTGSGGALSDTDTVFLTTTPVNDVPTIGNLAQNLRMAIAGQAFTITYASLLAALSGSDIDGDILQLRVDSVVNANGTLTKNGVAVIPGATSIGPGESLVWTPPANINASLVAFVVRAVDAANVVSDSTVTVTIDVATITRYLRNYNPRTDYHFFTMSQPEANNAVTALGYRDETTGRAGFAVATGPAPVTHAIHRMYNPNNNRHYYTANTFERDALIGLGYKYEKDEGSIFTQQVPGTVPIFRLYNTNTGTHLLVETVAQRDSILAQFAGIWVRHADFGFAFPVTASGSPPITAFSRSGEPSTVAGGSLTQTATMSTAVATAAAGASNADPGTLSPSLSGTLPRLAAARTSVEENRPLLSRRESTIVPVAATDNVDQFWADFGRGLPGESELDSRLSQALWGEN